MHHEFGQQRVVAGRRHVAGMGHGCRRVRRGRRADEISRCGPEAGAAAAMLAGTSALMRAIRWHNRAGGCAPAPASPSFDQAAAGGDADLGLDQVRRRLTFSVTVCSTCRRGLTSRKGVGRGAVVGVEEELEGAQAAGSSRRRPCAARRRPVLSRRGLSQRPGSARISTNFWWRRCSEHSAARRGRPAGRRRSPGFRLARVRQPLPRRRLSRRRRRPAPRSGSARSGGRSAGSSTTRRPGRRRRHGLE